MRNSCYAIVVFLMLSSILGEARHHLPEIALSSEDISSGGQIVLSSSDRTRLGEDLVADRKEKYTSTS